MRIDGKQLARFRATAGDVSQGGGTIVGATLAETTLTENGTHKPPAGVDGFSKVTVAVPIPEAPECPAPVLEPLTITENGEYTPGEGVDGFSRVLVDVLAGGGLPDGFSAITTGTFSVASQTAMNIEHNLGVVPKVFVVYAENEWKPSIPGNVLTLYGAVRFALVNDGKYIGAWGTRTNVGTLSGNHKIEVTAETALVGPITNTYGSFQPTQNTTADGDPEQLVYRWYAIA